MYSSKEELPHVTDQIPITSPADQTKLTKWLNAGGGVDLGDEIKHPLGIETEALILDFDRLKTIFKSKFDSIQNNSFENIIDNKEIGYNIIKPKNKYYNILDIDIDIDIDIDDSVL